MMNGLSNETKKILMTDGCTSREADKRIADNTATIYTPLEFLAMLIDNNILSDWMREDETTAAFIERAMAGGIEDVSGVRIGKQTYIIIYEN